MNWFTSLLVGYGWMSYATGRSTAQRPPIPSRRYGHGETRTPKDIERERAMHVFNTQFKTLKKRLKNDKDIFWW